MILAKLEKEVEIEEESDNAFGMIQNEVNEDEEKASVRTKYLHHVNLNIRISERCHLTSLKKIGKK